MNNNMPLSGALPISDEDMPKKNSDRKKVEKKSGTDPSEPKQGSAAVSAAVKESSSEKGNPLNPYCDCKPCKCEPPCTCGLNLVERELRTYWDSQAERLTHTVTEVWTPTTDTK